MDTVTVEIDVTKLSGRKLVKDLSGLRCVKMNFPNQEISGVTFTHEEVWKKMEKRLNDHYGTNKKLEISI